ncbi:MULTISPECIES: DUF692 family multinuclear iron-containing protein [unclassified Fusibacter]|uniref:multinuclear nonheme iron-dependent oxidase n=1 Tax=unclassified Fusibacter TaxID=2624464 RepID=UPI0013E96E66|nr:MULTISPECIES: DUF692 family multinuclear iron-containing protein [unclassified Fusibacter]MCK8059706.1 DUF692 family protein [Fusibacter sp. A2]NPE21507.1 DUF692 family protein [Fusibacter sp. A1]
MKLGCNLSEELFELLNEKKVSIDYMKLCMGELFEPYLERASAYKPLMVHYLDHSERTTMPDVEAVDFDRINRFIKDCASPITGLHCFLEEEDFDHEPTDEEAIQRMKSVIHTFKQKLNVPLVIENYPYSTYYESRGNLKLTGKPSLFHELCESCDINMILDIGHARVTADHYQLPLEAYLTTFPLHRVVELHLNGVIKDNHGTRDGHEEMKEEDYLITKWLFNHCHNLEYVTLEYGGIGPKLAERSKISAIERQLTRLRRMMDEHEQKSRSGENIKHSVG